MGGFNFDVLNSAIHASSIVPQTATSTVTGTAADMKDTGPLFAELQVGAVSGTTTTCDVKIQECDTSGGTYADITGATFTQVTTANQKQLKNFKRSKRFLKAVATIGGSSPSFALAVSIFGRKVIQS